MVKRIRLSESTKPTVRLKINSVDFFNLKEKANIHVSGRGIKQTHPIIAVDKNTIELIIADYETMLKHLKKAGISFERALHYSQTGEWKVQIKKPVSDKDIPEFLRKDRPKKGRVKL